MVFYRKYRPQTISELDSAAVRDTLTAILTKGKNSSWDSVPHAFLFTGPKGLGKTSTARIIAKVLNCEHPPVILGSATTPESRIAKTKGDSGQARMTNESIEPCNVCDQCVSITNGSNMDILEIDAASNRGIDEIRDLKEKIRLAPVQAEKKVYIIDEVHMLTTEAFNALLKTLEEPPAHAVFILCTTEPHKVPATILSRCFHVTFKPATLDELVRSFRRIADAENMEVTDETLKEIGKMAEGGFRDGVKMLEEAASMVSPDEKGKIHLTKEVLEKEYKYTSTGQYIEQLLAYIEKKKIKEALQLISTLTTEGLSIREFVLQFTNSVHGLLLEKLGVEGNYKLQATSYKLTVDELRVLLERLEKVQQEMRYAVLPQLPLELMIIDVCNDGAKVQTREGAEEQEIPQAVTVSVAKDEGVTIPGLKRQVGNIVKIKALYGEKKEEDKIPVVSAAGVSLMHLSDDGMPTKEWVDQFWRCIIDSMKLKNHTIAGVLRGCMPSSFDRKSLVIETAYKFHKEKLDTTDVKATLEQICTDLTGSPVSVSIQLKV